MDIREQQKRLYTGTYFGTPDQSWKSRLLEAFAGFAGIEVEKSDPDTTAPGTSIAPIVHLNKPLTDPDTNILYDIFCNSTLYSQVFCTTGCCRNNIISLGNLHPDENWSFSPSVAGTLVDDETFENLPAAIVA